MKKHFSLLWCFLCPFLLTAQTYDTSQLKTVARIWSDVYLFHPSVIVPEKGVNWEQRLVKFLPELKKINNEKALSETINKSLLSVLSDPFTNTTIRDETWLPVPISQPSAVFDLAEIPAVPCNDLSVLPAIDSMLTDRHSQKPLVIDLRMLLTEGMPTPVPDIPDYLCSMLTDQPLPLGQLIAREHYGWDEFNNWYFYEQRWKLSVPDRQVNRSGWLMPLNMYAGDLQNTCPGFDATTFSAVTRPVFLLITGKLLAAYRPQFFALAANRPDAFILCDQPTGSQGPGLIQSQYGNITFTLNTSLIVDKGTETEPEIIELNRPDAHSLELAVLTARWEKQETRFGFGIEPGIYEAADTVLSVEEKLLGIIKLSAIISRFSPEVTPGRAWPSNLGYWLETAANTPDDNSYYKVVMRLMATLHDSHVSTFHPSIFDFSQIFAAPVAFAMFGDKVLVTALAGPVEGIGVGDEISSIDGRSISRIIAEESPTISHSNRQGLLATLINPGYFTGTEGSTMKLGIVGRNGEKEIEIPRSIMVYQLLGGNNQLPSDTVFNRHTGYINPGMFTDGAQLEEALMNMTSATGLIIDLRNAYPPADFDGFLEMLFPAPATIRQSSVPVVSADAAAVTTETTCTVIHPSARYVFKGRVVVLSDKSMISRPEDMALALKARPNTLFIGEQTQGTDGEMTRISLPGGGETSFTGQKIYFGNGTPFQHTGIVPDVVVIPTQEGIRNHHDEILEKALEILK